MILMGAIMMGFGAAIMWTAEGSLILEYAKVAEEIAASDVLNSNNSTHVKTGTLLGVFWSCYMASSLSGGIIAFFSYSNPESQTDGTITMYVIFLIVSLLGAFASFFIASPHALRENMHFPSNKNITNPVMDENTQGTTALLGSDYYEIDDQLPQLQQCTLATKKTESIWKESIETLKLFTSKRMMLNFSALFFYIGFTQPYQIQTFGNRFFDDQTLAIEIIFFYSSEVISGVIVGKVLDAGESNDPTTNSSALHTSRLRKAAMRCLSVFIIITTIANLIAVLEEKKYVSYTEAGTRIELNFTQVSDIFAPTISFVLWGFSDGFIQTYSYWLIGIMFTNREEVTRVVGFYRCMQALGWATGYALAPTSRISPTLQLGLINVVFVAGFLCSLRELPR